MYHPAKIAAFASQAHCHNSYYNETIRVFLLNGRMWPVYDSGIGVASRAPCIHPNSILPFWRMSMETTQETYGDLGQQSIVREAWMGAENCVRCSQDTAGARRMDNLCSGCSLLPSALCTTRPSSPLLPATVWGPASKNQQQPRFHLEIHSSPALLPWGVARAGPRWAEECRLWIRTRPKPLGTLPSSGIKYWSQEAHMNRTRPCQPSRPDSMIFTGVTGQVISFFLDFSPERREPQSSCSQPSCHHVGKPAGEKCPPNACRVERFRKKPAISLGLSDDTMPAVKSIPRLSSCLSQYVPFCLSPSETGFSCWQLRVTEDMFLMALICKCYHSC